MEYLAYAYHNKALNVYTLPLFDDHETSDVVLKQLNRRISSELLDNPEKAINTYMHLDFCLIGKWNDETGLFTELDPKVLLDCSSLLDVKKDDEAV